MILLLFRACSSIEYKCVRHCGRQFSLSRSSCSQYLRIADVCIAGVTDLSSLDSIANDAANLGIRTWVVKDATEVVPECTLSASSYQAFKVTDSVETANVLKA